MRKIRIKGLGFEYTKMNNDLRCLQGSFEKKKVKCIPLTPSKQKGASVYKKMNKIQNCNFLALNKQSIEYFNRGTYQKKKKKRERFLVYI